MPILRISIQLINFIFYSAGSLIIKLVKFWKRDELVASETTAFSEHSSITTDNLSADSAFLFRVRPRLVNGHGPWSSIVEAFTAALDEKPGISPCFLP